MRLHPIGIVILFGVLSCKNDQPFFHPTIVDAVHHPAPYPLFRAADSLRYALDFPKAVRAYSQLLQGALAPNDSLYVLLQLAHCHLAMSQDSVAAHWLKKTMEAFPDISAKPLALQGDLLFNRGVLAYHFFQPEEAIAHLKEALEVYRSAYPPGHLRIGQCLAQLTLLLIDFTGTPDSVFKYSDLCYQHFQSNPQLRGHSRECELAEALACLWKRSHEASQSHADLAFSMAKSAAWPDTLFMAWCLSAKGYSLKKQGQNEADPLKRTQFFKDADLVYRQAVQLGKKTGNLRLQQFYRDWANNCVWLKDSLTFSGIVDTLDAILAHQPDRYAMPEWLRAYFHHDAGEYEKAIFWADRFEKRYRGDPLRAHIYYQNALYILMESEVGLKNYDAALKHCVRFNLSGTPLEGKPLQIEEMLRPEVYQLVPYPAMQFDRIGQILWKKYGQSKEPALLLQLMEIYLLMDDLLFPRIRAADEDAVLTFQKEIGDAAYPIAMQVVWELYQKTKDVRYLDLAFRFSERMKSFLLFRNMSGNAGPQAPPQPMLDSLHQLETQINRLKWLREQKPTLLSPNPTSDLANLQGRFEALNSQLSKQFPVFYQHKMSQPVPAAAEVKSSLRAGQAMVHYFFGSQYLHALYFDRDTVLFVQIDSAATIKERLMAFREILSNPRPGHAAAEEYSNAATWLYRQLLGGFAAHLNTQNELLVVPDKSLQLIPFEALLEPSDKPWNGYRNAPYLIRRLSVHYSPAWKIYQNNRDAKLPATPRILAFTYGPTRGEGALPYAGQEVASIRSIFGKKQVDIAMDGDCTKEEFLRRQRGYDILHLSLHAASSHRDRRDNKIFFQLPSRDTLYGFELQDQPVTAGLVVLSACETAFGKTEGGEGAWSLSRFFLQAGAKNVAASLWKIDDAATAKLMGYFYEGLAAGKTPGKSLYDAKIRYVDGAEMDFAGAPGFWSGLIGTFD